MQEISMYMLICFTIVLKSSLGTLCRRESYRQYNTAKLSKHLLRDFTAPGLSHCVTSCLSSEECISFNWEEVNRQCQLNNAAKDAFPADVITEPNWNYYGVDVSYKGQCAYVNCENSGVCEPTCGNEDRFVCHCTSSLTGRRCHIHKACTDPLGMASGNISDSQIQSSSKNEKANYVRLSDSLGWYARESDSSPWIKVQFMAVIKITGVVVKGGTRRIGWVTKYGLSYSEPLRADSIDYVDHSGIIKVFSGNTDTDTEVTHLLDPVIIASTVTLRILSCEGNCSLRMEILGCRYQAREIGWAVKNRQHSGGVNVVQTWITPIQFTSYGVVTHWQYWAGRSVPLRAMVLRNVDNGGTLYDIIGINDIPAGDTHQIVTYQVPYDKRINVQAGDVIGFAWNSPGPKHVVLGNADDSDVLPLKLFTVRSPDDLNENDRLDASATQSHQTRAYSIMAITTSDTVNVLESPLGMEDGAITNEQLTASSYYLTTGYFAWDGRLNNAANYWATSSGTPSAPWIQVAISDSTPVTFTAIQTQGCGCGHSEWVTTLRVQTGDSEGNLQFIKEGNEITTFTANSDINTIVTIVFPEAICGSFLRINPTTWHDWCSIRFEVFGYPTCT